MTMMLSTTASLRQAHDNPCRPSLRFWLAAWVLGLVSILMAGCGGSSAWPPAPAGLSYAMTSAVYEVGQSIVPNRPSASGGAVDRYTIAPALPAGLVIDAFTGVISGAPTAVAAPTVHTVTAENAGGSATARVQVEVRQTPAAPSGLRYRELAPVYTIGQALVPNEPTSSGGPITGYAVAPALPAGLSMDARTGVIAGTPSALAAAADYVVTGTNVAGSATVTLRIAVEPMPVAPTSLAYDTPVALYVTGEPITPNTAQLVGGTPSAFSVAPALPAGLSLNTATGAITGTPTALKPQATYTVTAGNAAGSVQAQVRISVTGRGSWSAAGAMAQAKYYTRSVTLLDGRVLVLGGRTSSAPTGTADIYDPVAPFAPVDQRWTSAAPMLVARSDPMATLMADGRVLVAGGDVVGSTTTASAEIYDPAANTWTATGPMMVPRTRASITMLPGGKVLVIGGYDRAGGAQYWQTGEMYDPAAGTWSPMGTMLVSPRAQHAAELLPDGSAVLLIGGINTAGHVTSAELLPVVPGPGGGLVAGSIPAGNVYDAVRLADGSILAVSDSGTTVVRFHPSTSSWTTSTLASGTRRSLPTLTRLLDGRVLLAGGYNLATAEIYNPDIDTWTIAASMSTARNSASASLLADGSVLVVGGASGSGELAAAERFAP